VILSCQTDWQQALARLYGPQRDTWVLHILATGTVFMRVAVQRLRTISETPRIVQIVVALAGRSVMDAKKLIGYDVV
jgi:hypothetical protein